MAEHLLREAPILEKFNQSGFFGRFPECESSCFAYNLSLTGSAVLIACPKTIWAFVSI
jgi:hypothetical protein